MKKRWGKPITQVQRFVPQEYAVICPNVKYTLKGVGGTGYGTVAYNNIRIDWSSSRSDGIFQNAEAKPFRQRDRVGLDFTDFHAITYDIYVWKSGTESNNTTPYVTSPGGNYSKYTGPTLYMVGDSKEAYIGYEKSSSN